MKTGSSKNLLIVVFCQKFLDNFVHVLFLKWQNVFVIYWRCQAMLARIKVDQYACMYGLISSKTDTDASCM